MNSDFHVLWEDILIIIFVVSQIVINESHTQIRRDIHDSQRETLCVRNLKMLWQECMHFSLCVKSASFNFSSLMRFASLTHCRWHFSKHVFTRHERVNSLSSNFKFPTWVPKSPLSSLFKKKTVLLKFEWSFKECLDSQGFWWTMTLLETFCRNRVVVAIIINFAKCVPSCDPCSSCHNVCYHDVA